MKWEKVKLSSIAELISGNAWSANNFRDQGNLPIIRIQNLGGNKDEKFVYWNNEYDERFLISKGDMLLSLSGSIKINIWEGTRGLLNQRILKIIPKNDICKTWLFWYLTNELKNIESIGKNAIINNVSVLDIKNWEIPLPPLHIQQQIADTLDKADALRRKDQELLKKYDELAQAIFYDMFGDPSVNTKKWKIKKLSELYSMTKEGTKCGPFGSALKKEEYVSSGTAVWVMDNIIDYDFYPENCLFITNEKYQQLISYSVSKGDIIISRAGTVGKMCVIDSDHEFSIISTNLIRLSLNHDLILPQFFVSLMKYFGSSIGRLKKGADGAFTHMNTGVLNDLEFGLPPLKIQKLYINILIYIKRQTSLIENRVSEKFFQNILKSYFS